MGAFASEKVEKVVTTPRGVGTHPPTTGKTAVRPTATAKYPATAAMAVWSVVSVGSSMVPPARRPEVVTHALFGKFSRAHFSSVPRFEQLNFHQCTDYKSAIFQFMVKVNSRAVTM